ncbi:MAG: polysaccharide biosynthesis C-terminal domain-containing protein, partial [Muribaculaceae bacterium]|nr:polysaccharide biosynthesis C-terminal domain-containing protein [Muribaculaceae bacterium]
MTNEQRNKKFIKDFGVYAIGNLGSKLVMFLMVPLYTYFIKDPADYGYYDLCQNFCLMMIPITMLQLRDGAFRFLLGSNDEGEKKLIISFVARTLLASNLTVVALTSIVGFFMHIPFMWHTIALLLVMTLYEVQAQIMRGLGNNKAFVAMGIITSLGIGVMSVVLVGWLRLGILGVFWANIASRLLSMVILELKTHSIVGHLNFRMPTNGLGKQILRYSLPLIPTAVCWWATSNSNRYFIKEYCGLDANGLYAMASKFAGIILTLSIIFYQTWQETAIVQYHSKDRDRFFSNIFNNYIYVLALLLIGYTFIVKICSGWLVGETYQAGIKYIYPLGAATVLYALTAFFELGYQCSKETGRALPSVVLTASVCLLLNFTLIPTFGIDGAIASSIIAYLTLITYRWIETKKRYYTISFYRASWLPLIMMVISAVPFAKTTAT